MRILFPLLLSSALLPTVSVHANEIDAFYSHPVYQVASDQKSCEALPQGVPVQMGVTQDTSKTIKVFLGGRAATVMWEKEPGMPHSSYFYLDKERCETLELSRDSASLGRDPDRYVAGFESRVGHRLHFQSDKAEQIVREYRVECGLRHPGRYVPLINLLYASLSSYDHPHKKQWLEIQVQDDRGGVLLHHELHGENVTEEEQQEMPNIRIQSDGRITSALNPSVLSNACRNAFGPIWRE